MNLTGVGYCRFWWIWGMAHQYCWKLTNIANPLNVSLFFMYWNVMVLGKTMIGIFCWRISLISIPLLSHFSSDLMTYCSSLTYVAVETSSPKEDLLYFINILLIRLFHLFYIPTIPSPPLLLSHAPCLLSFPLTSSLHC